MTIRVEVDRPVTTVMIDRPEVGNAVDRKTADALRAAFAAFAAAAGGRGGDFRTI